MGAESTGDDTRQLLVEAAITLLQRHGPSRISLDDIARQAGVSRRTLYRNFANRQELLDAAMYQLTGRFLVRAAERMSRHERFDEKVAELAVFTRSLQPRDTDPGFHTSAEFAVLITVDSEPMLRQFVNFLEPYIKDAIDSGELRPDLHVARAADWMTRMVMSVWPPGSLVVDLDDREDLRAFVRDFAVNGLAPVARGEK
jgi:AcrR family transcriptional regulator